MTARAESRSLSIVSVLLLLLVTSPLFAQPAPRKNAAPGSDKRVLIISIDGMRPDVLLRAKTPNIRGLMEHGAFTMYAESTDLAITLPSHVSMLTGVSPAKHGITWNDDREVSPTSLTVPTLFELAKKAGYSTALVPAKKKLCILAKAGTVDWLKPPEALKEDAPVVANRAADVLRQHRPQVMFVHLPDPDAVGHARGWGSQDQIQAAEKDDDAVGKLMAVLGQLGLREKTLVIVTADHGGSGKRHGRDDPRSRYIPWIAVGPGVRENYDLTLQPKLTVSIVDVFATALHFLGVAIPPEAEGKPVLEAFGKADEAEPAKAKPARKKQSLILLPVPAFELCAAVE